MKFFFFLIAGVALVALLFPPWERTYDWMSIHSQSPAGYAFILSPPMPEHEYSSVGVRLDLPRLAVELAALAIAFTATKACSGRRKSLKP